MTFIYSDGMTGLSMRSTLLDLCSCSKDDFQENPEVYL
jgi:hypothetical protein